MIKNTLKQIQWLRKESKPFHASIFYSTIIDLVSMGLSLAAIYFSKQTIDIATGNQSGDLWVHAALMIACILGSMIAGILNPWMIEKTSMKFQMKLQMLLNGRMMAASWKNAQQWHTGDILNRMVKDCGEVIQLMVYTVPSLLVTLIELMAALVFLFMLDSRIAWLILFSTPLLLLSKIYYKRMRKLSKEWKSNDSRVTSVLQENTTARLLIASLGAEKVRKTLLEEGLQTRLNTGMEQLKIAVFSKSILQSVFNIGYFIAFLLGIYYLSEHLITFGTMVAFIQLVGRVQGPIFQFISFVPGLIRVRASVERIMELDDCPSGRKRNRNIIQQAEYLKINNLHFGYNEQKIIEGMDFTIKAGEPVAIMGHTGAGKTTLIRLIAGILEPDHGNILLKGDGNDWDTAELERTNFVYVPQGNSLFSGTVRENLRMVSPEADEEKLKEVLHMACADFVWNLPQGLDTAIGENGFGLSEGQAQRLAVARAMLLPGSVWIFDEVTAALDATTAKQLVTNLLEKGKDKIMLFVTHDAALKEQCAQTIHIGKN